MYISSVGIVPQAGDSRCFDMIKFQKAAIGFFPPSSKQCIHAFELNQFDSVKTS